MRRIVLLLAFIECSCAPLTQAGAHVSVYQAPLDAPPARREMPTDCRLVRATPPTSMTELDMTGQKDPYRTERNRAAAEGANALLVLSQQTVSRHDAECPSSSPITDCPPSFGAWFRVVFESYSCPPDALQKLATPLPNTMTFPLDASAAK